MPKHFALLTIPAHGHVTPTLAVVAELVRHGHRVTFATTAEFAPAVAATGADVLLVESTLLSANPKSEVSAEDIAWAPVVFLRESVHLAPALIEHFADDQPDLILYDVTVYPVARMLSRIWDRPVMELFPCFAANEQYSIAREVERSVDEIEEHPATVLFRTEFAQFLIDHGLTDVPVPDVMRGGDHEPRLVFLSRDFQFAGDTFDERFRFVGPCLGERSVDSGWTPPTGDASIVYVSLGTAHNLRPDFFQTCVEAFGDEPVHVVMSIGDRVAPETLGPLPANVEVHARVPQLAVLQHADVFVCHAGMGSTMESLYYGTPLVAVPQMPEQAAVAHRIAELGLGTELDAGAVSPDGLREAVRSVSRDDAVHRNVQRMQREVQNSGGTTRAVDEIEAYAAALAG